MENAEKDVLRLTVNLPAKLHRKFKIIAVSKGVDMSTIVKDFVERYVEENEPEMINSVQK